jgi:hypothetical protein
VKVEITFGRNLDPRRIVKELSRHDVGRKVRWLQAGAVTLDGKSDNFGTRRQPRLVMPGDDHPTAGKVTRINRIEPDHTRGRRHTIDTDSPLGEMPSRSRLSAAKQQAKSDTRHENSKVGHDRPFTKGMVPIGTAPPGMSQELVRVHLSVSPRSHLLPHPKPCGLPQCASSHIGSRLPALHVV